MKKIVSVFGLIAMFAVVSVFGQQPSHKLKIDFAFKVAGKTLPAGQYEFVRDNLGNAFTVKGEGKNVVALIVTRMSGTTHTTPQDAHFVFDVVGNTYALSEIWLPKDDGYLMLGTKAQHTHKVVDEPLAN